MAKHICNALAAAVLMMLAGTQTAWAGDGDTGWSVTLYGGPSAYDRFSDMVNGKYHMHGAMVGLAVDKDLFDLGWDVSVAVEGQLAGHVLSQTYGTGAIGIGLRFHRFIWDNTSLAIYAGPSYAIDPPKVPEYKYGPSYRMRKFLNYVGIEFAVAIPGHERHWDAVIRTFHRSGAWGLYSTNVDEGSAFGIGLRARF